jgi:LysM repeat protein
MHLCQKGKLYISRILQANSHYFKIFICSLYALYLTGCAAISFTPITTQQKNLPGVYHRVEKGQTLWKISKLYNIELEELMRINRISDTSNIEINQMLFIPQNHPQSPYTANIHSTEDFSWPLKGKIIAGFGQQTNNMINKGINIQAYTDSAVVAARSGRVIFCNENFLNFGKTIIIDHGDGFFSVYTGNSKVIVKTGDSVNKGTAIAKIEKSGRAQNSYLHFEIRKGYNPQNPNFYLPLKTNRH